MDSFKYSANRQVPSQNSLQASSHVELRSVPDAFENGHTSGKCINNHLHSVVIIAQTKIKNNLTERKMKNVIQTRA